MSDVQAGQAGRTTHVPVLLPSTGPNLSRFVVKTGLVYLSNHRGRYWVVLDAVRRELRAYGSRADAASGSALHPSSLLMFLDSGVRISLVETPQRSSGNLVVQLGREREDRATRLWCASGSFTNTIDWYRSIRLAASAPSVEAAHWIAPKSYTEQGGGLSVLGHRVLVRMDAAALEGLQTERQQQQQQHAGPAGLAAQAQAAALRHASPEDYSVSAGMLRFAGAQPDRSRRMAQQPPAELAIARELAPGLNSAPWEAASWNSDPDVRFAGAFSSSLRPIHATPPDASGIPSTGSDLRAIVTPADERATAEVRDHEKVLQALRRRMGFASLGTFCDWSKQPARPATPPAAAAPRTTPADRPPTGPPSRLPASLGGAGAVEVWHSPSAIYLAARRHITPSRAASQPIRIDPTSAPGGSRTWEYLLPRIGASSTEGSAAASGGGGAGGGGSRGQDLPNRPMFDVVRLPVLRLSQLWAMERANAASADMSDLRSGRVELSAPVAEPCPVPLTLASLNRLKVLIAERVAVTADQRTRRAAADEARQRAGTAQFGAEDFALEGGDKAMEPAATSAASRLGQAGPPPPSLAEVPPPSRRARRVSGDSSAAQQRVEISPTFRDALLKTRVIVGILGVVRFVFGHYLVLAGSPVPVGVIGRHRVVRIGSIELLPLFYDDRTASDRATLAPRPLRRKFPDRGDRSRGTGSDPEPMEEESAGLMGMMRSALSGPDQLLALEAKHRSTFLQLGAVLSSGGLLSSPTYDLTRPLQHLCRPASSAARPSATLPPRSMFLWNASMLQPLVDGAVLPASMLSHTIYGSFEQQPLELLGHGLRLTLLARRSRHFAGTRYQKRGVTPSGWVANEVEVEQILDDQRGGFSSLVQVRGSIPTAWTQRTTVTPVRPPIRHQPPFPDAEPACKHFKGLVGRYGAPVMALNLVKKDEKNPRESLLAAQYAGAVAAANARLAPDEQVQYLHIDYAALRRSFRPSAASQQHQFQQANAASTEAAGPAGQTRRQGTAAAEAMFDVAAWSLGNTGVFAIGEATGNSIAPGPASPTGVVWCRSSTGELVASAPVADHTIAAVQADAAARQSTAALAARAMARQAQAEERAAGCRRQALQSMRGFDKRVRRSAAVAGFDVEGDESEMPGCEVTAPQVSTLGLRAAFTRGQAGARLRATRSAGSRQQRVYATVDAIRKTLGGIEEQRWLQLGDAGPLWPSTAAQRRTRQQSTNAPSARPRPEPRLESLNSLPTTALPGAGWAVGLGMEGLQSRRAMRREPQHRRPWAWVPPAPPAVAARRGMVPLSMGDLVPSRGPSPSSAAAGSPLSVQALASGSQHGPSGGRARAWSAAPKFAKTFGFAGQAGDPHSSVSPPPTHQGRLARSSASARGRSGSSRMPLPATPGGSSATPTSTISRSSNAPSMSLRRVASSGTGLAQVGAGFAPVTSASPRAAQSRPVQVVLAPRRVSPRRFQVSAAAAKASRLLRPCSDTPTVLIRVGHAGLPSGPYPVREGRAGEETPLGFGSSGQGLHRGGATPVGRSRRASMLDRQVSDGSADAGSSSHSVSLAIQRQGSARGWNASSVGNTAGQATDTHDGLLSPKRWERPRLLQPVLEEVAPVGGASLRLRAAAGPVADLRSIPNEPSVHRLLARDGVGAVEPIGFGNMLGGALVPPSIRPLLAMALSRAKRGATCTTHAQLARRSPMEAVAIASAPAHRSALWREAVGQIEEGGARDHANGAAREGHGPSAHQGVRLAGPGSTLVVFDTDSMLQPSLSDRSGSEGTPRASGGFSELQQQLAPWVGSEEARYRCAGPSAWAQAELRAADAGDTGLQRRFLAKRRRGTTPRTAWTEDLTQLAVALLPEPLAIQRSVDASAAISATALLSHSVAKHAAEQLQEHATATHAPMPQIQPSKWMLRSTAPVVRREIAPGVLSVCPPLPSTTRRQSRRMQWGRRSGWGRAGWSAGLASRLAEYATVGEYAMLGRLPAVSPLPPIRLVRHPTLPRMLQTPVAKALVLSVSSKQPVAWTGAPTAEEWARRLRGDDFAYDTEIARGEAVKARASAAEAGFGEAASLSNPSSPLPALLAVASASTAASVGSAGGGGGGGGGGAHQESPGDAKSVGEAGESGRWWLWMGRKNHGGRGASELRRQLDGGRIAPHFAAPIPSATYLRLGTVPPEASECRSFEGDHMWAVAPGKEPDERVKLQRGVLRTNCIDSLDRTNAAQHAVGVQALGLMFAELGIMDVLPHSPSSAAVEDGEELKSSAAVADWRRRCARRPTGLGPLLVSMYERMGDAIAEQYAGSAAHRKAAKTGGAGLSGDDSDDEEEEEASKPRASERGQADRHQAAAKAQQSVRHSRNGSSGSSQIVTTVRRYINNSVFDQLKQVAMNLWLGVDNTRQLREAIAGVGAAARSGRTRAQLLDRLQGPKGTAVAAVPGASLPGHGGSASSVPPAFAYDEVLRPAQLVMVAGGDSALGRLVGMAPRVDDSDSWRLAMHKPMWDADGDHRVHWLQDWARRVAALQLTDDRPLVGTPASRRASPTASSGSGSAYTSSDESDSDGDNVPDLPVSPSIGPRLLPTPSLVSRRSTLRIRLRAGLDASQKLLLKQVVRPLPRFVPHLLLVPPPHLAHNSATVGRGFLVPLAGTLESPELLELALQSAASGAIAHAAALPSEGHSDQEEEEEEEEEEGEEEEVVAVAAAPNVMQAAGGDNQPEARLSRAFQRRLVSTLVDTSANGTHLRTDSLLRPVYPPSSAAALTAIATGAVQSLRSVLGQDGHLLTTADVRPWPLATAALRLCRSPFPGESDVISSARPDGMVIHQFRRRLPDWSTGSYTAVWDWLMPVVKPASAPGQAARGKWSLASLSYRPFQPLGAPLPSLLQTLSVASGEPGQEEMGDHRPTAHAAGRRLRVRAVLLGLLRGRSCMEMGLVRLALRAEQWDTLTNPGRDEAFQAEMERRVGYVALCRSWISRGGTMQSLPSLRLPTMVPGVARRQATVMQQPSDWLGFWPQNQPQPAREDASTSLQQLGAIEVTSEASSTDGGNGPGADEAALALLEPLRFLQVPFVAGTDGHTAGPQTNASASAPFGKSSLARRAPFQLQGAAASAATGESHLPLGGVVPMAHPAAMLQTMTAALEAAGQASLVPTPLSPRSALCVGLRDPTERCARPFDDVHSGDTAEQRWEQWTGQAWHFHEPRGPSGADGAAAAMQQLGSRVLGDERPLPAAVLQHSTDYAVLFAPYGSADEANRTGRMDDGLGVDEAVDSLLAAAGFAVGEWVRGWEVVLQRLSAGMAGGSSAGAGTISPAAAAAGAAAAAAGAAAAAAATTTTTPGEGSGRVAVGLKGEDRSVVAAVAAALLMRPVPETSFSTLPPAPQSVLHDCFSLRVERKGLALLRLPSVGPLPSCHPLHVAARAAKERCLARLAARRTAAQTAKALSRSRHPDAIGVESLAGLQRRIAMRAFGAGTARGGTLLGRTAPGLAPTLWIRSSLPASTLARIQARIDAGAASGAAIHCASSSSDPSGGRAAWQSDTIAARGSAMLAGADHAPVGLLLDRSDENEGGAEAQAVPGRRLEGAGEADADDDWKAPDRLAAGSPLVPLAPACVPATSGATSRRQAASAPISRVVDQLSPLCVPATSEADLRVYQRAVGATTVAPSAIGPYTSVSGRTWAGFGPAAQTALPGAAEPRSDTVGLLARADAARRRAGCVYWQSGLDDEHEQSGQQQPQSVAELIGWTGDVPRPTPALPSRQAACGQFDPKASAAQCAADLILRQEPRRIGWSIAVASGLDPWTCAAVDELSTAQPARPGSSLHHPQPLASAHGL